MVCDAVEMGLSDWVGWVEVASRSVDGLIEDGSSSELANPFLSFPLKTKSGSPVMCVQIRFCLCLPFPCRTLLDLPLGGPAADRRTCSVLTPLSRHVVLC